MGEDLDRSFRSLVVGNDHSDQLYREQFCALRDPLSSGMAYW